MMHAEPPLRARLGAVAAASLLLAAGPIAAQKPPAIDPEQALEALLGTEIEGASRRLEKLLDAPAAVSVIGRSESQALNHVTLADMLHRLPGTYVTTSRGYSGVGLRGFNRPGDYNARMLMSIDGYRVNDALFDQALPEFEFPIVADWVKRLELINGPSSSVYGGNALLGVANVVTLDGADAPGLRLRAQAGSGGSHGLTGHYGWHRGDSDLFVGLASHHQSGETLVLPELAAASLPDGRIAGRDGTRYGSLFAKWRHGLWRATVVAQARNKEVPVPVYGSVPGAAGTGFADHYAYGELAYDGAWSGDWRPQLRFNVSRTGFDGRYVFAGDESATVLNRDIAVARWIGGDLRMHGRGWINHALALGIEMRRTLRGRQVNADVEPATTYLDRDDRLTQVGLYVQDQIRLSDKAALTLGLRADHVEGFALQASPRAVWIYRRSPTESLKLIAARAFRAPNLYERFYDDAGVSQVANPGLRPEKVGTLEAAWERAAGPDARVSLVAYRYRISDLIDFVPVDEVVSRYENVRRARTSGLDLEVEQRLASGWHWRSSLSLAHADADGVRMSNSPRWLFKGHLLTPVRQGWSAGLQWTAMGQRDTPLASLPAFSTVDAAVRLAIRPDQSISLTARNLTDRVSYDPATIDMGLLRVPRERRSLTLDWRLAL